MSIQECYSLNTLPLSLRGKYTFISNVIINNTILRYVNDIYFMMNIYIKQYHSFLIVMKIVSTVWMQIKSHIVIFLWIGTYFQYTIYYICGYSFL